MNLEYRMIAPCYFGAESAAAFDIRRIGAKDVTVTDGRVAFTGGAGVLAAANLHSRCAERILLLLKTGRAETFDALFDLAYSVPWEELMPADAAFPVKGSSLSSQLSSVPACQSIVKKAVVERLKKGHRVQVLPESGGEYRIRFSLRKNEAEIMLDTSGEGLHKRGYRKNATLAPIKETLAAAMVKLSHYNGRDPFCDPFCGSGTIAIEAALIARNRAPGLNRSFAAQHWAMVDKRIWLDAADEAMDNEFHDKTYEIWGGDIDPHAVEIARHNAELAEVDDTVRFEVDDATRFHWGGQYGRVVTNPPYGERLLEQKEAEELYRAFGRAIDKLPETWRVYVLSSHTEFERCFGRTADKKRKLYNGMLKCDLFMYGKRL